MKLPDEDDDYTLSFLMSKNVSNEELYFAIGGFLEHWGEDGAFKDVVIER